MSATELFRRHLANVGNPTDVDIYADDIVVEFPYAPRHHTGRLEGREGILRFLTNIGKYFENFEIGEPRIHLTADPNVLIAEYPGRSKSKETGLPYNQNYVAVVTVRDGQIAHLREYYNPIRVLVSGGEISEPGE